MSNGSVIWRYTYDDEGLRTQRTNGILTYTYAYSEGQLKAMTVESAAIGKYTFVFRYGPDGRPYSVRFEGTEYFYVLNAQGDVVAIRDKNGALAASYTYDAWGNGLTSSAGALAQFNPLRYRGYVYDRESGLYYLKTRYYNPEIGRFISPDNYPTTGQGLSGNNMFVYCGNNPVSRADDEGEWWHVVAGALIGGAFELGAQLISNGGDFSEVNWTKVGIATVVGGATALCGPISGAAVSGAGNVAMELADGTTDVGKLATSFAVGVGSSLIGSGVGHAVKKIGGKVAMKSLSKKSPGQIKKIVNAAIDVAGSDRNKVKNLTWTTSQEAYKHLPDALVGKTVPQIFNSIAVGISGYGTMGAIYGFK